MTLVTNDVVSAADKGNHCAAIFVDLTKAFDTIDHATLQRLCDTGLIPTPANGFRTTRLIDSNVSFGEVIVQHFHH